MKVCLITGEYPPMQGGVADYTRELASALVNLGVDVSVLTSSRAREQVGSSPDPWTTYPVVEKWNFRSWRQILAHLHAVESDIAHIQYQTSAYAMHPAINLLPLWLRRQLSHPGIVTTLHDLRVPYLFPKAGRIRNRVTLALIRGSDRTIVTNEEDWVGACALSKTGLQEKPPSKPLEYPNIHTVPIGSNIPVNPPDGYDRFSWRQRLGVATDQILLSYFGLLNQSKGVEILLEALRDLVNEAMRVRLLMVGAEVGDSDPTNIVYHKQVLRQVAEMGLQEHIIWTGYSTPEDVSGHLLASDICVLPFRDGASFRRGSLHAALAHGLPVVSTKSQSSTWEEHAAPTANRIIDGQNTILVPPNDPGELRQAIEDLIQNPEKRARLGNEASKLAEAFSWPLIAQKTLAIYEEILQS